MLTQSQVRQMQDRVTQTLAQAGIVLNCVDTAGTDADRGGRLRPERIGAHGPATRHLHQ